MKRIAGVLILLTLVVMTLSPAVALATEPPDMVVVVEVDCDGDLTVYVNGDQLANQSDIAGLKGLMTGSAADLWVWDVVNQMWKVYIPYNEARIELLMDSQAKTILMNQAQQGELASLDIRLQRTDDTIWSTKSQINQNEVSIQHQQESLAQTDALLLSVLAGDTETAQWLEVNSNYRDSQIQALESKINQLEGENENNDLMVYGGYGLAACCMGLFVIAARRHR